MTSKYDPVLKRIPQRPECPEIVFRQAGDGFLEVVYGSNEASANKTIKDILLRSFRVMVLNQQVRQADIPGLTETVPGAESLTYVYDPLELNTDALIQRVSQLELALESVMDESFDVRVIRMPLAFDHSLIKKSIDKFTSEINPDAVYCKDGSNLDYIARYNGITVEDLKQRFCGTEWIVSMVGFFPGLPFCYPLKPTGALTCPKYNPARTWTPEGAVDLADYCMTIFGVASGGGCQLVGRTIPIFQATPTHSQFAGSPALFRPTDVISFYEETEEAVDHIYELIRQGQWEYQTSVRNFSVREWVEYYDSCADDIRDLQEKQRRAQAELAGLEG